MQCRLDTSRHQRFRLYQRLPPDTYRELPFLWGAPPAESPSQARHPRPELHSHPPGELPAESFSGGEYFQTGFYPPLPGDGQKDEYQRSIPATPELRTVPYASAHTVQSEYGRGEPRQSPGPDQGGRTAELPVGQCHP